MVDICEEALDEYKKDGYIHFESNGVEEAIEIFENLGLKFDRALYNN